MKLPKRKPNRIPSYDYSLPNIYFITLCTKNRTNYFWNNTESEFTDMLSIPLSDFGLVAEQAINEVPNHYPAFRVDNYTVMPNHIHLLLRITTNENGRSMTAPTVSTVINQMKGIITKRVGFSIWQKGFYDHIIRSELDYRAIWEYIDNNPIKWKDDELFVV